MHCIKLGSSVGCSKFLRLFSINFGTNGLFSITGGYYFGRPSFLGGPAACPPGNFEILDSRRWIFLHFEVYFYFSLLFLGVNQFEQIMRKKNCTSTQIDSRTMHYLSTKKKKEHDIKVWPQLALSMSSTNVGKNRYHSISLILTLEQNILITITSWQLLVFILSPSFLSIPATALHIFSLRYYTSV